MRVPYNNDDVCESFNGVQAVAFICEGFDGKGGDGKGEVESSKSMEEVITATYSDIPLSIVTESYPSSYLVTATPETVTSTSAPAVESTTSASVSSSMGAPQNSTSTSATLSSPSTLRTGGASTLARCSRLVVLLIPACWLFSGL
jgi:hypothetical protein